MKYSVSTMKLSEARSKLTQLDKLLLPGEALQINKRGKPYARIELIGEMDGYDRVLNSINLTTTFTTPSFRRKPESSQNDLDNGYFSSWP